MVAADDCIDSLDFGSCILWLDHSTGADHRSRAFQITPSVALSLSLGCRSLNIHSIAASHRDLPSPPRHRAHAQLQSCEVSKPSWITPVA